MESLELTGEGTRMVRALGALLAVVLATLLISATCSLLEATLYSTRVPTLEAAKEQGRSVTGADNFLRMKRNIGVPTSAILILNTIANTAGATFAGMLAGEVLGAPYLPLFSGILTLAILLFSEILPKTFGATYWKNLWSFVVWPLVLLEKVLRPLIWLTQAFSSLFIRKQPASTTTEDEIIAMIRMGANSGELTAGELRMLTSVFHFDDARAGDVMFPRHEAVFFDANWTVARCLELAAKTQHTRYPICDGTLDELRGMAHLKDIIAALGDPEASIAPLARPLHRVPESMPARALLRDMQRAQPHMVAVVDEHGTTVGFVTLQNLIEQLVGAVGDEFDSAEPEIRDVGNGEYLVHGRIPIARLNVELDLALSDVDASTLSGAVVDELGRLPSVGDTIALPGIEAEVLQVEHDRATRMRVRVTDLEAGELHAEAREQTD